MYTYLHTAGHTRALKEQYTNRARTGIAVISTTITDQHMENIFVLVRTVIAPLAGAEIEYTKSFTAVLFFTVNDAPMKISFI